MKSKNEIQEEARTLIESKPEEAVTLYLQIWKEYNEEFNQYDTINILKALRIFGQKNIRELPEIVGKFNENTIVSGLCGWFIYDNFIKKKSPQEILSHEPYIYKLIQQIEQRNVSQNDKYPCPYTLVIFGLISAHANNLYNARKIYEYCSLLNPELLSKQHSEYEIDGKKYESPSSFEEYFQHFTKATFELNKFDECRESCKTALETISKFHYNNDVWFNMRLAQLEHFEKNYERSEKLFMDILSNKDGADKWFIYKKFSELLFSMKKYDDSWIQSLRSGVLLNNVNYSAGLCLHQARILFKLQRVDEAIIFAEMILAGINEQLWKNTPEYQKLIQYFKLSDKGKKTKECFRKLYTYYKEELFKEDDIYNGIVIFVHQNNKVGKIKMENGEAINFTKSSFNQKRASISNTKGAEVSFVKSFDVFGKEIAENIKILKTKKEANLSGQVFEGVIQNIVEFGIFVDLKDKQTGLAHVSTLPKNFKELYTVGNIVKVVVLDQSKNRISLKIKE